MDIVVKCSAHTESFVNVLTPVSVDMHGVDYY